MTLRFIPVACILLAIATSRLPADDMPSLESAAELLQAATVTVRVSNPSATAGDSSSSGKSRVTVCSGVAVGENLVVTPIYAASDSQIRITIRGGEQSVAKVRVIDEYSGLALLETETKNLHALEINAAVPRVGMWVLSAAGWGTDDPLVSVGIVGGVERTLSGATYPPLLQCDMRVAETSGGAALADRRGQLIGVVIVADMKNKSNGWTYAIPARHVQRLLRMKGKAGNEDSITVLKRRRPVIGMVLDGAQDGVVVSRIDNNSPAQRAGILVGDKVVAADGVKIRSVYQAVRPMLYKQPGDKMEFILERGGQTRSTAVVLGGGVELPSAPFANLGQYVQPKLDIEGVGGGLYSARGPRQTTQEVFAPSGLPEGNSDKATDAQKIRLLQRALDGYQQAIRVLQQRLSRQEVERGQTEKMIQSLEKQIESLKVQVPSR